MKTSPYKRLHIGYESPKTAKCLAVDAKCGGGGGKMSTFSDFMVHSMVVLLIAKAMFDHDYNVED